MKIDLIYLEDWIGIYVDGKLKAENHTLSPEEVLDAVGIKYSSEEIENFEYGHLPENFKDI